MVAQYMTAKMSVLAAAAVLFAIILLGVVFDVIGVAFSTCDITPFVALASKKDKSARQALSLLKNAAAVSNFCNDVIGDICGIVSGAAGAAIAVKILTEQPAWSEIAVTIGLSAVIAACTVALKSAGKSIALKNNKIIVGNISRILSVFSGKKNER